VVTPDRVELLVNPAMLCCHAPGCLCSDASKEEDAMARQSHPTVRPRTVRTAGLAALLLVALAGAPRVHAQSVAGTTITNGGTFNPAGVAVDSAGDIFVPDCFDNIPGTSTECSAAQNGVYKLTPDGSGGYTPARIASDTNDPGNAAVDSAGTVFVADFGSGRLVTLVPDASGTHYAESSVGTFTSPNGVAVARDLFGNLYVTDRGNGNIYKLTPVAGGGYNQTTIATIANAFGVAVDAAGNVFVVDSNPTQLNNVFKISPLAGSGYGPPVNIAANIPAESLALDGAGVLYLPDLRGDSATVYTLTPQAGGTTYTPSSFAVTGVGTFQSEGIAVAPSGNIFISDTFASTHGDGNRLIEVMGVAKSYTLPAAPGAAATPELGSGELLATGLLPIGAILLYRRRRARRVTQQ